MAVFICPKISVVTEITVKIAWIPLLFAIFAAPAIATTLVVTLCVIYPPALLVAYLVGITSLYFGYLSYLILAGPLMVLAQWLGGNHPLIHGAIGYGAIWLIPAAHGLGLPFIADPSMVEMGQWFGPVWCAVAAAFYGLLRREFPPREET